MEQIDPLVGVTPGAHTLTIVPGGNDHSMVMSAAVNIPFTHATLERKHMTATWNPADDIPAVTAGEMFEIDRIMVEEMHVALEQMMENAGRSLAEVAIARFHPETVTVLVGPGGNGGGGLVAARHLANRGVTVALTLAVPARDLSTVPAHQLDITTRMGITISDDPRPATLIIDALIGYSLHGDPRGRTADLIDWANGNGSPILALDLPSGLNATTGHSASPCIRADATLTLALPKTGLRASAYVGQLYLADISVPPVAYERLTISVPPLFRESPIIEIPTATRLVGGAADARSD